MGKIKLTVELHEVLEENRDWLMEIPGVVGVGEGKYYGKPCITVLVSRKSLTLLTTMPEIIQGYHVRIRETGGFEALK